MKTTTTKVTQSHDPNVYIVMQVSNLIHTHKQIYKQRRKKKEIIRKRKKIRRKKKTIIIIIIIIIKKLLFLAIQKDREKGRTER